MHSSTFHVNITALESRHNKTSSPLSKNFTDINMTYLRLQIQINVQHKRKLSISLKNVILFSGKPEPSIKWFKEGHDITQNADFEITYKNGRVALKIPEAFEEDAGHYECRAANKAGTAKSNAELVVKGRLFQYLH